MVVFDGHRVIMPPANDTVEKPKTQKHLIRKVRSDMRCRIVRKTGFTLVEIMIVVAIIGLLAAVAIPNLVKARKSAQRQACITNLKTIEGAKGIWALEMKKNDADVPQDADIFGPDKNVASKPSCPAGGTYDLRAVSEKPTCTVADHTL